MVDRITSAQRSALMARVRVRDTQPEKIVRSLVHGLGFRFRVGTPDLPGKPDIVLRRHHKVIFVHGCFWHQHAGCRRSARPKTRRGFWNKKLDLNIARDQRVVSELVRSGWAPLIVWECETKDIRRLKSKLRKFLCSSTARAGRNGRRTART